MNDFEALNVLNYGDDKCIERNEVIDVNYLNFIAENGEIFKNLMRADKRLEFTLGENYDPSSIFSMAKDYLNLSKNGIVNVKYIQKKGVGRYFAVKSMSLQSITRQIRQTIAQDYYIDIDMKNCHPNILLFICKNLKINCDILRKYCNDREGFFNENNITKDIGKQIMLSIINGGTRDFKKLENPTDELIEFYEDEMPNIHNRICSKFKELFKEHEKKRKGNGKNYNHKASFMNHILCDIESKILNVMDEYFGTDKNAILCFDGIMLPSGPKYNLEECEKVIYDKLKINIKLDIKPFEDIFDLSTYEIPKFIEISEEKRNVYLKVKKTILKNIEDNNINDKTLSEIFNDMVKDVLITTNGDGDGYLWSDDEKLWIPKDKDELMFEICNETNLILKVVREIKQDINTKISKVDQLDETQIKSLQSIKKQVDFVNNKIQSTKGIRDIYTQAKKDFRNDKFKTEIINRNHDFLPIRNGKVINLITGNIRDRTKDDKFSTFCNVNFITDEDKTIDDDEYLNKFVNQISMDNMDYIKYKQIKMGSYLSGQNYRDIDINHGDGKNGKSTEINALKLILGDFCGFIGKDVIVFDKSQHRKKGGGGHTSHLIPIDGKRLIITQELEENDVIDSEMVKKIASSDPIEGVRECFAKKTWTMNPFCKLVICSNKIPKFDTNDKAITDRLVFNPYKARFLNKEAMNDEKNNGLYNESKYNYYEADNDLIEKYKTLGRPIDIYFSWLVKGCMEFYKVKNNGISKPKIVKEYITEKSNENDVIGIWINECCNTKSIDEWVIMNKKDKKVYTTQSNKLYENFSNWASMNEKHKGIGKIDFNIRLENSFTKSRSNEGMVFHRITTVNNADDD
jgi:phage/plasmid-associated DNA primase